MKKCKDCAHYNVCEFHLDEETSMTVEECGDFMDNNCDNCKYKVCLAKLFDMHVDCKDCPIVECIMGVADNNVGKNGDERMKVYELVKKLNEYNPNADIDVVVNGFSKEFEIYFGGSEGCQPYNCDCVDLTVDTPCEEEGSETTVDIKIEDMDLSVRSYNCLKRAGLNSLSQLSKLSYEDFANIRNLGKRSVDEIIDKLKYYGYKMARSDENDR